MLDALLSGKLVRDPQIKTSSNGNQYIQFLMSVSNHGEADTQIISGIGFDESVVERISKLKKGDSLAVAGSLKQTEWQDKATNETKRGLSVTANQSLSVYDINKKRKPKPAADSPAGSPATGNNPKPFDDDLDF
jgi:single-stranded DNA-binding protein